MKRRDFVKKAAVGAAAGGMVVGGGIIASGCGEGPGARRRGVSTGKRGQVVRWRLASSFPKSLAVLFGAADQLADRVKELTGGNFQINTYQGGEIVPALGVLDAVQQGSVEMGHTASYYYIGKNPALAFDTTVPFGLTVRQHNAWLYSGGGLQLIRDILADFNIINFPGGNTGVQMGGWFRNPVGSLADLKGLKMRIPGLGGKVMERLGVTAQVIPGSEVYIALERGAIDAAEWVGPYDDAKLGLHEVAKNYYYPGWWEPAAGLSYYVNRDAWEKLPSEYQAALQVASAESNIQMLAGYDARNAEALQTIRAANVALRPFPDDIMVAAKEATRQIMDEQAASNPQYASLYRAYTKWGDLTADWLGLGEKAYQDFMFG